MNYLSLNKCDVTNGNGIRCTLYTSGCCHHCKGCHNPESWDPNAGTKFTKEVEDEIIDVLRKPYIRGLTLSGGDPMLLQNQTELLSLVKRAKSELPDKDIWVWTGYEWEDIKDSELTKFLDVIVVGRFVLDQRDISDDNRWRGSRNQRVILVQESLKQSKIVYLPGIPNNE